MSNPQADDPGLQLFQRELLELTEQIGEALTDLIASPSSRDLQRLSRSVQLINQGAVQMHLPQLETLALRFKELIQTLSMRRDQPLSQSQIETATQLFRRLQHIDVFSTDPLPDLPTYADVESLPPSLPIAEASLTPTADLAEIDEFSQDSIDMRQMLLQKDIQDLLDQIQRGLKSLHGEDLILELKAKTEAILGWGEVLNWAEVVELAKALAHGLEAYPEAAQSMATIAFLGLQSLHREALQLENTHASRPLSCGLPPADSDALEDTDSNALHLYTDTLFIWQAQNVLFSLKAKAIAEILIPRREQLGITANQRSLFWRDQELPLLNVKGLLIQQSEPLGIEHWFLGEAQPAASSIEFGQFPVLVVHCAQGLTALEVEIEQFIQESELVLQISPSLPSFCLGKTTLGKQSNIPIVDVLELVNPTARLNALPTTMISQVSPKSSDSLAQFNPDNNDSITSIPTPDVNSQGLSSETNSASNSVQILIVDDSRTIRYLLQKTFESAGYTVIQAQDGLDAIHQLKQHPKIKLIVSDVEMPNLTGFEFLTYCRRNSLWKSLPIIILSQCSTEQHQQLAIQFGADAYFTKPYIEAEFLGKVASILAKAGRLNNQDS